MPRQALPTLLVTAFEPFGDSPLNPSAQVLPHLTPPSGWKLERHILPVDTTRLPTVLNQLWQDLQPALVLSLGEARGATAFRVERTARNRFAFGRPDNAGVMLEDQPIFAGAPAELAATLCLDTALAGLRAAGHAADFSDDAGGYLCNQLFYTCCHRFAGSPTRVGFLHIPSLPEQGFGPGLRLETQVQAVQGVLNALTAGP